MYLPIVSFECFIRIFNVLLVHIYFTQYAGIIASLYYANIFDIGPTRQCRIIISISSCMHALVPIKLVAMCKFAMTDLAYSHAYS